MDVSSTKYQFVHYVFLTLVVSGLAFEMKLGEECVQQTLGGNCSSVPPATALGRLEDKCKEHVKTNSICFHSLDCCRGCCVKFQCVEDAALPCQDSRVVRSCEQMRCPAGEECFQQTRFCLTRPCPQPLPVCRLFRPQSNKSIPLPVQY